VSLDALTTAAEAPGFYGKLPARGDFIGRRLARSFTEAWDAWLQQAILASRAALGASWLDLYLVSPLWRFALAAGACGPDPVAGVMMPSVDAVGRYFPLMLGRQLAAGSDPAAFLPSAGAWYAALEERALAALVDGFDLSALDRPLPLPAAADRGAAAAGEAPPGPGLQVPLGDDQAIADICRGESRAGKAGSIWWTAGSERVAPCLLFCPGLPMPVAFASLLDGDWRGRAWRCAAPPDAAASSADSEPAWDREE